jgi:hypothetical protein
VGLGTRLQAVTVEDPLDAWLGLVGDLGDGVSGAVGRLHPFEVGSEDDAWLVL